MSAITSLYLIGRGRVMELAKLAGRTTWWTGIGRRRVPRDGGHGFFEALDEYGYRVHPGYEWSGYCMLHLLDYLRRRGVRLERSELRAEASAINRVYDYTVLVTPAHKAYLDRLDPAVHKEEDLRAYFDKAGYGFEEAGIAAMNGLELLHNIISCLGDREVLLLHIG